MGRLAPFVLLILILAGLVIGLPYLLRPESHRAEISAYLAQRLHHTVSIGSLEGSLLPPVLRMTALSVLSSDGSTPMLQSDHTDVGLDWRGLLRLKIQPTTITFTHWTSMVRRKVDGSWDTEDLFSPIAAITTGQSWPLTSVTFKDGECRLTDSYTTPGQELMLKGVDGVINLAQNSARGTGTLASNPPVMFAFDGKGHFFSSPQWTGELRLAEDGRLLLLQLTNQNGLLDAKGLSKEWHLGQVQSLAQFYGRLTLTEPSSAMLNDWQIHFAAQPGRMMFEHSATISGGKTEASGVVEGSPAGMQLRMKGAAQDLPLNILETGATARFTEGKLTGISPDLTATLSTEFWSSLSGEGSVEIKDGRYRLPETSAKSLAKAKTLAYLQDKFPGFLDQGLPFQKAAVRWKSAKGMVTISEATLKAKDLQAALAGRIDLSHGGSDAYLRLQIHETAPKKIRLIPVRYRVGSPGHEKIQPMYGHLQGTWREWTLRAQPSRKVPAAMQSRLRAALK